LKPATLAIAWTLAKAPHIVPIPGTRAAAHLEECATAAEIDLTPAQLAEIERALPLGYAAGERYSEQQWVGIQKYLYQDSLIRTHGPNYEGRWT
jgi:diketogulonate reductase-like aldo/keto reductase